MGMLSAWFISGDTHATSIGLPPRVALGGQPA